MKKYFLFDLDGTLTDPKVGITTCVQYALQSFGIQEPDLDKLEPFIGPPLKESFMEFYGMDGEQADEAVEKYRERFNDKGIYENEIYPGMARMLQILSGKGFRLAVASSKPTVYVERILEHFGIRQYFKAVVGSELDGGHGGVTSALWGQAHCLQGSVYDRGPQIRHRGSQGRQSGECGSHLRLRRYGGAAGGPC